MKSFIDRDFPPSSAMKFQQEEEEEEVAAAGAGAGAGQKTMTMKHTGNLCKSNFDCTAQQQPSSRFARASFLSSRFRRAPVA